MNKHFLKLIWKISITTFVLVFVVGIFSSTISSISANDDDSKKVIKTNENSFQNASNPVLGKTGIALSINVWTRFKDRNELPANLYTEVLTVAELLWDWKIQRAWILAENMELIAEYRNVLKTDIKWLLHNSFDRAQMLRSIVSQFQYRHDLAVDQMRFLINQKTSLETEAKTKEASITAIKAKIQEDFAKADANSTYENIEKYIELQNENTVAKTYTVFINQMINDYAVLNNYTKELLELIVSNKDAIIKDSYVVVPSSGLELLRDFDLLYDKWKTKN